jgi:polysaccharide export outer membrane protein
MKMNKIILFLAIILIFSSCISNRRLVYFPNLKDSTLIKTYNDFAPKIQIGDILYISASSADPNSAAVFSSATIVGASISSGNINPGIIVERDGNIILPKIGVLQAEGKTKKQLIDQITDSLAAYLKDPIVNIRLLNFRVTLLGEFSTTGQITTTNEKLNILEALGKGGDLTRLANRDKILLFRDSANTMLAKRINIKDPAIFSSPYFYLQSNDVLYAEPYKATEISSNYLAPINVINTASGLILGTLSAILLFKLKF